MKTVAVAGASGFLGRSLCQALQKKGFDVQGLGRKSSSDIIGTDYNNIEELKSHLRKVQVLCHVAGQINGTVEDIVDANLKTTQNLVTASKAAGIERFIYVSSAAAAMLKGEYGKIKKEAEDVIRASDLDYVIFRPTLIYGHGDTKNVAMMYRVAKLSPVIPVLGGGRFKVQPVYIDDAVSILAQAVQGAGKKKVYNVSGPEQISLREMFDLICTNLEKKRMFVPIPLKLIQKILKAYSAIIKHTRLPVKQIMELDKHEQFDFSETSRDFTFLPIPFEAGLKMTIAAMGQ